MYTATIEKHSTLFFLISCHLLSTPNNSNLFQFPLKVQVGGSWLYIVSILLGTFWLILLYPLSFIRAQNFDGNFFEKFTALDRGEKLTESQKVQVRRSAKLGYLLQ